MKAPPTLVNDRTLFEAQAADLSRRFPGVVVWFGFATRHWWAMVATAADRWCLVEANDPYDLARSIEAARPVVSNPERWRAASAGRPGAHRRPGRARPPRARA
jgi:hypothetical protein